MAPSRAGGPGLSGMVIVIRRSYAFLEDELRRTFEAELGVEIVIDRRRAERRASVRPVDLDRRMGERRRAGEDVATIILPS